MQEDYQVSLARRQLQLTAPLTRRRRHGAQDRLFTVLAFARPTAVAGGG
jgi:hypothetical protein